MYRIEKQDLSSIFGFITIGLMLGHIGPLLSAASVDLGLEAGVVGQTIAIYYGISILGILAGFSLVKRFGKEWFVLLGSVLLILGYLMGLGIQSSLGLFLVTVVLGLGLGAYQIGVNSLAVERTSKLPESRQSGRLAYMQFFFGIGAVVAPLLVDFSHLHFNNWRYSFPLILVLGPVVTSVALFSDLRRRNRKNVKGPGSNDPLRNRDEALEYHSIEWTKILVLLLVLACLYTSLETSVFNWLSFFWDNKNGELEVITGARVSALFWLMFSISRLTMGWVVMKLGDWKAMLSFSSVILSVILVWWLFSPPWGVLLVIVVVLSLMMGCMFPTLMMVISRLQPGDSSQVVGILFVVSTASASVIPVGIGEAIKRYDLSVYPLSLMLLGICFLALLATVYVMKRRGVK